MIYHKKRALVLITMMSIMLITTVDAQVDDPEPVEILLENAGSAGLEGHTSRSFEAGGPGLYAGDELHQEFPEEDGVQAFMTFELENIPKGDVSYAVLRAPPENILIKGTPFNDLGPLQIQEVSYDEFSESLNELAEIRPFSCEFAKSEFGPFVCDVTSSVQSALDEGKKYVQYRLRFHEPSDGDGEQDQVMFFITGSDINQEGIFEMEMQILPDPQAVTSPEDYRWFAFITPVVMLIIIITTLVYILVRRHDGDY